MCYFIVVIGCSLEQCTSEIVLSALHVIRRLCDDLINGNITMDELTMYHNHYMTQLEAICVAANSGVKPACPDYSNVSTGVTLCFQKYDYVMSCCQKLETLVKYCTHISSGKHVFSW